MEKTLEEMVKEDIMHDKNMINGLRGDISKLEHDIRYYEGRLDSLQEVLEKIKSGSK